MSRTNSRRDFIKTSAWVGGGLFLSIAIPVTLFRKGEPVPDFPFRQDLLRIGTDNSIEVILAEVEMGQGIWTTLPMLLAEELDCNWKDIKVSHAPPGIAKDFQAPTILKSTGGSDSTVSQFDVYRQAGAVARTMLVKAAATQWGIAEEDCTTENGYVITGNRKRSFGELALAAAKLSIPEVKLRDAKQWKYIGKSQNRLDIPEKISGKAVYGIDIDIPGKQIALVAHPPVFGATIISFDASKAKAVPGVTEIVQIPTGLAVLATNFWAAKKGRELLEILWNHGANEIIDTQELMESYSALAKTSGVSFVKKGDVDAALKKATHTIIAEYRFPFLAHAPMEPLNCTVKISSSVCEIWAGTQAPLSYQEEVAKYLGCMPEQVLFYTPHLGGGFGRRGSFNADWIMEAVHIAKISGQIIKLIWTREDDIKGGYYRPVYVHRVKVGVGTDGYPMAWKHCIVGQSLFTNTALEKLIVIDGIDYSVITNGAPYTDHISDQGSELIITKVGVPVLPWRSVGNTHTAFVMETLIDVGCYKENGSGGLSPVFLYNIAAPYRCHEPCCGEIGLAFAITCRKIQGHSCS
jgi:isoquinoline 1-oxidoreductase subunit beta